MKSFILLFLAGTLAVHAQTYEVGLLWGGANGIGDVGSTNYIDPSGLMFGAVAKWNKSKRYAWRASFTKANIIFDDTRSSIASRAARGYKVNNTVTEYSVGIEFHFVEYNLHKLGPAFTPYIYTGPAYFRYTYDYVDGGLQQTLDQKDGAWAIPMVLGAKYRLNQFLILSAEVGARYTFTNNLDASYPVDLLELSEAQREAAAFGNLFSDDWYVFSGIGITYTFGRKPCQDCFE